MLSPTLLSPVYNADMAGDDMLDTKYMTQPRGEGTVWVFRMRTPEILVGRTNPRTNRPYGNAIRESLKSRSLVSARRIRDVLLGQIRREELQAYGAGEDSLDQAIDIADELNTIDHDEKREAFELAITDMAEALEKKKGEKYAVRWAKVALGEPISHPSCCAPSFSPCKFVFSVYHNAEEAMCQLASPLRQ